MQDSGWKQLCREIMNERDPERLFALADALNRVMEPSNIKLDEAAEAFENVSVC
jgi:hypothetical protein